jgi:hypothetical protein
VRWPPRCTSACKRIGHNGPGPPGPWCPPLGFELFERHAFPLDSVEIEEKLRARVPIPEPGGRAELVAPCDFFLKRVG